jgi:hypothetical protein
VKPQLSPPAGAPARVVDDIERFLREMIARMPPDPAAPRRGPGRLRVLPALALWAGLLVCVRRGVSSQLALWRLLTLGNFWPYPRFALSDQAVYDRLEAAGTAPWEALFAQASQVLAERLAPDADAALAPCAPEVLARDHTKLDQIARRLPALRGLTGGDLRLLPGQLAGRFDLRRRQWRQVRLIADPHQT